MPEYNKVEIADIVCKLKDQFVPRTAPLFRDGTYSPAVIVPVNLDINFYGYLNDDNKQEAEASQVRAQIFFLLTGGHLVLSANTWDEELKDIFFDTDQALNSLPWKSTANHDSAWRGDGVSSVLNRLIWKMEEKVIEHLTDEQKEIVRQEGKLSFHHSIEFQASQKMFLPVACKFSPCGEENRDFYHGYKLEEIKQINFENLFELIKS